MSALIRRRAFVRQVAGISALVALSRCSGVVGNTPQAAKLRRIGYLSGNSSALSYVEVLRQTLVDLGYVEGRDFVIDIRISEGLIEPLAAMAGELIAEPVDVLLAEAVPATIAATQATSTTPIVFAFVPDPLGLGLVGSLARPGGNVTGVPTNSTALSGKKLELLKDAVPGIARVAVLWRSNNPGQVLALEETRAAAQTLGLEIEAFGVPLGAEAFVPYAAPESELDIALEAIALKRVDAILMLAQFGPATFGRIVAFATKTRLPQMSTSLDFVRLGGGLMAIGPDYAALARRASALVAKILRGARPADLPVEQPTQFEFVVNLAMAQRIGLTIPDSVLRQATEVIR